MTAIAKAAREDIAATSITYPLPQERITTTRRDEREVYVRERCPACQGTGRAAYYDPFGCLICRKCNGEGYVKYWQPAGEFLASLGNLTEIIQDGKVQP